MNVIIDTERFHNVPNNESLVLILQRSDKWHLGVHAQRLDKKVKNYISQALASTKNNELIIHLPQEESPQTIVVLGISGDNVSDLTNRGADLFSLLSTTTCANWTLINDTTFQSIEYQVLLGFDIKGAVNNKYKSNTTDPILLTVYSEAHDQAEVERVSALSRGISFAKQLITTPPNDKFPVRYAEMVKAELKEFDAKITVFDKGQLELLGMNCLLAVARGSAHDPIVLKIEINPDSTTRPTVLIGKGVIFDSGGLCVKPPASMLDMKADMSGSAVVIGAIRALLEAKSSAHVIGLVGLVENAIDGESYRPSDILRSHSKKTVEVIDTDAEGRLLLADLISYAESELNPRSIVDIATLTGAIQIALGRNTAGLFSNNQELAQSLIMAGESAGEALHQFPISQEFTDALLARTSIADIAHLGKPGVGGQAILAAAFLQYFVNKVPWAHLDIAGTSWNPENKLSTNGGCTGYGVRLLYNYCQNQKTV
jgi:leucyl aminopeptidase